MKINESRKSTHTIMSHQGFGGVLFKHHDFEMFIPQEWLFKNGAIKKYARKQIEKARLEYNLKEVV